jgi:hypothetical protein
MDYINVKPEHYCPICHVLLQYSDEKYFCHSPYKEKPLHYYSHHIIASKIVYQEFSVDLGNKWVMLCNDYNKKTSNIYFKKRNGISINVPFIINPDFPDLISVSKKIKTVLVFG